MIYEEKGLSGEGSLTENGETTWTGVDHEITAMTSNFSENFTVATVGCAYSSALNFSMQGEITDLQIYSEILDLDALMNITGICLFIYLSVLGVIPTFNIYV